MQTTTMTDAMPGAADLPADGEPERPLKDVRELLAHVVVRGYNGPLLEPDLSQHLSFAGHDLARDHVGDLLGRDFVPAVLAGDGGGHVPVLLREGVLTAPAEGPRAAGGEIIAPGTQ